MDEAVVPLSDVVAALTRKVDDVVAALTRKVDDVLLVTFQSSQSDQLPDVPL